MLPSEQPPFVLNDRQADLLRFLVQQNGGVSADRMDGRTLSVLERCGVVSRGDHDVAVTEDGRSYFARFVRRRRRVQARVSGDGSREARAGTVWESLRLLHQALPADALLQVGDWSCSPQELIDGLERFADTLEQGR